MNHFGNVCKSEVYSILYNEDNFDEFMIGSLIISHSNNIYAVSNSRVWYKKLSIGSKNFV